MSRVAAQRWLLIVLLMAALAVACNNTPSVPPQVAELPSVTPQPSAMPLTTTLIATLTPTETPSSTPTATQTPTWTPVTPIVVIATLTPTTTLTPSMTFTPSDTPTVTPTFSRTPRPSFTPTQDQPGPTVGAFAPSVSALVAATGAGCTPTTANITASITAPVGLYSVRLNFVFNNGQGQVVQMRNTAENTWAGDIGPFSQPGTLTYWITAADNWGKWTNTPAQRLTVGECTAASAGATATSASQAAGATGTAIAQGTNVFRFQAIDANLVTAYGSAINIALNAQGGTLPYSYVINSYPANGTLTGTPPNMVYQPNSGFRGDDTFTFLAMDAIGNNDIGIVRVTIATSSLVAQNQSIDVAYNTPTAITLQVSGGTAPYSFTYVQPANGTVTGSGPTVTYTPNAGFSGTDSFTWQVTDAAPATTSGTVTLNVAASPVSGGRIIFARDMGGGVYDLFTMNGDGSNLQNITNTAAVSEAEPDWAPNGTQIAFSSNEGGDLEICVANADGSGRACTNNASQDYAPAWSPNGATIAYTTNQDATDGFEIWLLTAALADAGRVTPDDGDANAESEPSWGASGDDIAYDVTANPGAGPWQIYGIHRTAGVWGAPNLLSDVGTGWQPTWAPAHPTNNYIVFVSDRDGTVDLYRMPTFGEDAAEPAVRLTNSTAGDASPSWASTGEYLLFQSQAFGSSFDIVFAWADGTHQYRLTSDAANEINPDWIIP